MAVKKFRLKAGKFFYRDKDGNLQQGKIGEIFEREETHVSYDMFEPINKESPKLESPKSPIDFSADNQESQEVDDESSYDEDETEDSITSIFRTGKHKKKRNR